MVSSTPRPHFTPGKDPVPILQETGWAPGPVWTGAENLVPTGIRSQTVQPVAQSLYRLSYPGHDRQTVDDEFIRGTERKIIIIIIIIIIKHNKMVNKHSKIDLGYNVMRGTEYSVSL